jgi:hypothetical protein
MEQFDANMSAVGWSLQDEQMNRLNTVSELEPGYPYNFIANARRI